MIYVRRDEAGHIVAVSKEPLQGDWEALADDAPELPLFAEILANGNNGLAATDLGLARVVEDLVELLIEKGAIRFTDFPEAAQNKLLKRRSMRESLHSLNLLDEGEDQLL